MRTSCWRKGVLFAACRPLTTRLLKLPAEAPAAAPRAAAPSAQPAQAQPQPVQPPAAHLVPAAAEVAQARAGLAHGPGLPAGAAAAVGAMAAGAPWGRSAEGDLLRGSGAGGGRAPQGGTAGDWAAAAVGQLLPVSAVAVGAAPDRAGGAAAAPSGADIAEDALAEERTAWRAQRFMASGDASSLQR